MPDPVTTAGRHSSDSPPSASPSRPARARLVTLVVVGVLVVFAIGMLVARTRDGTPGAGNVTAVPPFSVGTPQPQLPMKRIASVAELPAGPVDHVEVAYFHRTHRCSGCINAERLTRETLDTHFADRLHSGEMSLVVEDTEAPADPALVRRYEAWGSALYLNVTKNGTAYTWRVDDIWFYVNEDHKFIAVLGDQIRAIYGES